MIRRRTLLAASAALPLAAQQAASPEAPDPVARW